MLMPKKVKYRKLHRGGRTKGIANKGSQVSFGSFGIQSMDIGALNSREIEAARRAMTRKIKREGKVWIRIFPDYSFTRKGQEVPMGKGKGSPEFFVAKVKPGRVLFELDGMSEELAREALRLGASKLSVRTKFVKRVA